MVISRAIALSCTLCLAASSLTFADINRVRVVNKTNQSIYIHKGGYAQSEKILPGKWKVFNYPFTVTPPGSNKKTTTSLLIATASGQWVTSPKGFTQLKKTNMTLCLDYRSPQYRDMTGNRLWTIKQIGGFDKGCSIKGYKQPWYQNSHQA